MPRKKIIIIDDCKLTLSIARDLMENAGYEVETAESGIEGNQFIYQTPLPDLILIDVVMPMLNGDRKVRLLKDRDTSRGIPVVLMSTKPAEELQMLQKSSGADGYVTKPLKNEALLAEVRRLI